MPSFSVETIDKAIGFLNSLLELQAPDGSVFGKTLTTYHLLECLDYMENPLFYDRIEQAKQWCVTHREKGLNPYLLLAYLHGDIHVTEDFYQNIDVMLKQCRLDNGGFMFSRRFIAEGETFSTLIALKILVCLPDGDAYEAYCRSAFRFCYNNVGRFRSADHLGFLLWLYSRIRFRDFSEVNRQVLSRVLEKQRNGLWEGSVLATAYLIFDLMPYYSGNGQVQKSVIEAVRTLERTGVSIEATGYFEVVRYVMMLVAYYGESFRQAMRSRTIPKNS
jgi:hypothetical protein